MSNTTLRSLVVVILLLIGLQAQSRGATLIVGTCRTGKQYSTIQAAVNASASGGTVLVCPGIYPEQVIISQPLTLRGVQIGNAANPTVTVPRGGLTNSVNSIFFQIVAQDTDSGQINIENLTVNGSGNGVGENEWLAGIYYHDASGSIRRVATLNQTGSGSGFGILLESGSSTMKNVFINASSIHDFDSEGIRSNANTTPPSLTVSIRNNSVVISKSPTLYFSAAAIDIDGIGVISGNNLLSPSWGVGIAVGSDLTISNNTVDGFGIGIWPVGNSNTVKGNRVSMAGQGIVISGPNNDVEHNSFINLGGGTAISFNCTGTSNTVTHNIVNDSSWGIVNDTGGNVVTPNSFSNVTTVSSPPC